MSHFKGNTYIYTDGACQKNGKQDSIGGWGFVCDRYQNGRRVQFTKHGGEAETTNNRMELKAVLEALRYFFSTMDIFERLCICSDSKYIVNCINEKWYERWENNGWKTATGKEVANKELWEQILYYLREIGIQTVEFRWIKGHNGDLYNEIADKLALEGIQDERRNNKNK